MAVLMLATPSAVCSSPGAARKHWAYQPLAHPAIPAVRDADWPRGAIDDFLLAAGETRGIAPGPDASGDVLVRRLYFDLIGLPPQPPEIEAFARDHSAQAIELLVDRLLASPQFGERWARHWLDVARFAESITLRGLVFPEAWRYRDYVIDAFNSDRPFSQFLTEQICGDLLRSETAAERNRARTATGWLLLGDFNYEEKDKAQLRMDIADEQLTALGQGLLAQSIGCARCHDHKSDPIPSADYYAMAGIFLNTHGAEHGTVSAWTETPLELSPEEEKRIKAEQRKLGQLERLVRKQVERIAELQPGADRASLESELQRLRAQAKSQRERARRPAVMSVRDEKTIGDGPFCPRGDIHRAAAKEPRGFLSAISDDASVLFSARESGRRELAAWITSPDNPLTSRVFVNRVWHWLFGAGLVRTTDDFGSTGEPPENPDLLDYLARNFIEHGWSMKKLVREIVLSRAYRLASSAERNANDPENRLFLRGNRRRIEAECLRDAILSIGGSLDPKIGGPNIQPGTPEDYGYADTTMRRTIYVPAFRNAPPEIVELFDGARPGEITGERSASIVPAQALFFLNSDFILDQTRRSAARFLARPSSDRPRELYKAVLSRDPSPTERSAVESHLARGGDPLECWSELFQALFATADFRYVD